MFCQARLTPTWVPAGPLRCAPVVQEGAGVVGEDVVDLEADAVFGDVICGRCAVDEDELVPKPLPVPKEMTKEEVLKHCATRLPYHPGCQYCVA